MKVYRRTRQTSIAVTMLAVGAMLAACGGNTTSTASSNASSASPAASSSCPAQKDHYTIAFVPKALNNPVFEITRKGAEDKAKELGNVTIDWVGPATTDAAAQSQIIDDLVTKGVDGIILSANDASALDPSINRAVDAGIPVMTWDADAPKSKRLTNIGIDQTAAGKMAGEMMAKALPNGGKVAVLTGTPGALNLEQRLAGFKQGIAANPKVQIVSVDPNFDDVQKAVEIVETKINATPDLAGYFFVGMWPFFADLKSLPNLKGFVAKGGHVISLDSLSGALNAVDQGYANELVGYSWWGFGQTGVTAMVDYLSKCKVPADPLNTDLYTVDKSNIAEYLAKQKAPPGAF